MDEIRNKKPKVQEVSLPKSNLPSSLFIITGLTIMFIGIYLVLPEGFFERFEDNNLIEDEDNILENQVIVCLERLRDISENGPLCNLISYPDFYNNVTAFLIDTRCIEKE